MIYACHSCGYTSPKWMGFCPQCKSSDSLVAETPTPRALRTGPPPAPQPIASIGVGRTERFVSGTGELDRVLGGGFVPGSVVLLGGEPGVGKSTLLLQTAGALAVDGRVLVVSAEESADQVSLRAERLGVSGVGVLLLAEDDVDRVIAAARELKPRLLILDSIQAVSVEELDSGPGSVSQVREAAARLVRFAKSSGIATILVGHVTKDGGLAGPKLLEHMVDVVLYLEGDPDRGLRALRSFKNRFGATHVVALFDMRTEGLVEIEDPSAAFLSEWQAESPGSIVFPAIEGRRSVLVEIQALVVASSLPQPRRSFRGVDPGRVHQLLAVLQRHCFIDLSKQDVYVNVVGGWRLSEPAGDLPIALAVASSALDVPLGSTAAWGEMGLVGEIRPVPMELRREEEARRVGISRVIRPESDLRLSDAIIQAGLIEAMLGGS